MADNTQTVRYAPYIESRHTDFLTTVYNNRVTAITNSPFASFVDIDISDAFFGVGYAISSFPSLYDMYGKFMAGLDVEVLWSQIFEDTVNTSVVNNLISAEAALIDDEVETISLPRMQLGMRDINSVISSSFVVGRSIIEDMRNKLVAKFSAELKYRLIPVAEDRWKTHLEWNNKVVGVYAEIMKFYYSTKMDIDGFNYEIAAKDALWPFTVLDFEKASIGAMQGAVNTVTGGEVAGSSKTSKMIGAALSGAAMGAMAGGAIGGAEMGSTYGGWGALIGGVLGAASAM